MKIEIINLYKQFNEKVLFHNFNAVIPSGKMTGIYGASGSGKTTLLNMIGMIEPYSGTILFDGKEITSNTERSRMLAEKIGFVFQNYGLVDSMTVSENIRIMKCMKDKKNQEKMKDVLQELGLSGTENKKVYELSGGEQQRVAVAKIILKNADLILADEPTASLDCENKKYVLDLFRRFVEEGKTVLIVSHDQEVIRQCDAVINL